MEGCNSEHWDLQTSRYCCVCAHKKGVEKVMPLKRYVMLNVWPCPKFYIISWGSVWRGVWLGKPSGLWYVWFKMRDRFSTLPKCSRHSKRGWNKSLALVGGKNWCFFNVITPNPTTLALPLQQQKRASDLKLFCTVPTTQIWLCLTSGYLLLSGYIFKEFISPVMKKHKVIQETDF